MKDIYINSEYDHRSERDKVKVPEIQKDKQEEENFSREPPKDPTSPLIAAGMVAFIDHACLELTDLELTPEIAYEIEPAIKLFEKLKNLLTMLTLQDYSQNIDFAAGLSHVWHEIIEYCIPSTINRFKSPLAKSTVKQLFKSMKEYPKNDDHTLGYYLTNYAGENWLPFPFIQILKSLHEDFAANAQNNTLAIWLQQLSTIIKELYPLPTMEKK